MRKYKQLITGVIIGGVLASSTVVFAGQQVISAISAPWIKFLFNGQEKKISDDYSVLIYNDHTYVPARFVAEELGAEVKWDDQKSTVLINKKETKPDSKPEDKPQIPDTHSPYVQLPLSQTKNGVRVEVYAVSMEDDYSKFFVRMKNTTTYPMKLDQEATLFKIANQEYKATEVTDVLRAKDSTWYKDIREDEEAEGFVAVRKLSNDVREGELTLKIVQNDGSQTEAIFHFNIKW